ncbi:methionyl-tRNA formyltransferase [Fontibacter flavus]|uniref:Methionyl-tRNA formyltransferase n=1 Tax=Fontibacter flavus TaxID=654838 RepID=A0ABV6FV54_9BACT
MKLGLFLMTKKGFLILENLLDKNYRDKISFVCIGRDVAVLDDYSCQIESLCKKYSIHFFFNRELLENEISSDYNIAISWRWILKVHNLIVFHDSLLPKYRGFAPLVNMLINGENTLGATALFANEEYDKGDIIFQEKKEIQYPIKISDAIDLICELYLNLSIMVIEAIQNNNLVGYKQIEEEATYSLWLDEDDYFIDWNWPAEKIKRKIDACGFPFLGAKTYVGNQVVIIQEASVVNDVNIEHRTVGKTIFLEDNYPIIVCGLGLLKITQAKYEDNNQSFFPIKKFRIKFGK